MATGLFAIECIKVATVMVVVSGGGEAARRVGEELARGPCRGVPPSLLYYLYKNNYYPCDPCKTDIIAVGK